MTIRKSLTLFLIFWNVYFNIPNVDSALIQSKFEKIPNAVPGAQIQNIYSGNLKKTRCLKKCNKMINCKIAVPNESLGSCLLYDRRAENNLVASTYGFSYVKNSIFTDGLVNYWPIVNNDLTDYVGQADMHECMNESFVPDKSGTSNSAVFFNDGYCNVPPGFYFWGNFTIMAWVKLIQHRYFSRLLDFGNTDNVLFTICDESVFRPILSIFNTATDEHDSLASSQVLNPNEWTHIAAVNTNNNISIYLNGQLVSSQLFTRTVIVQNRTSNFIGRSNWYLYGDQDANAHFDEIKIFDRFLTNSEIISEMNNF